MCNITDLVTPKQLTKATLIKGKKSITKLLQFGMKHLTFMKISIVSLGQKLNLLWKIFVFFCQSVDTSDLHEVESLNTGRRLQSLIQNSLRSELKVRLNTAINTIDARAIDVKYHKNCFKEELRKQQHLIDPKGEKMKDENIGNTDNKGSNIEKIVEIEISNAFENEIRNGATLKAKNFAAKIFTAEKFRGFRGCSKRKN